MEFEADSVMPAPSETRIGKLESDYRIHLPEAYKEMLQSGNGGVPKARLLPIANDILVVERFLSILDDRDAAGDLGWYEIGVVWSQIEDRLVADEDMVGTDILPIAHLAFGDMVCLDYRESPELPSVCIWYHEDSDVGRPATRTIASDFTAFLAMLQTER